MLEMVFAFVLGFAGMAMGCFAVMDQDDGIQRGGTIALAGLVMLSVIIGIKEGGIVDPRAVIMILVHQACTVHLAFTVIGAVLGMCLVLYLEGTIEWLWRRIHPSSAPTEFIGAGQHGGMAKAPPKMSAALMGTSTAGFAVQGLDVKTTALIKLSMFAFKRDRSTIVTIENSLRLGDGRRYHAYQKLVADSQYEKGLTDIIHPYWRAINGNHSSARLMFTNLCQLARDSGNTNKRAVNRLVQIGQSLGLSPEDMGRAIGNVRA